MCIRDRSNEDAYESVVGMSMHLTEAVGAGVPSAFTPVGEIDPPQSEKSEPLPPPPEAGAALPPEGAVGAIPRSPSPLPVGPETG